MRNTWYYNTRPKRLQRVAAWKLVLIGGVILGVGSLFISWAVPKTPVATMIKDVLALGLNSSENPLKDKKFYVDPNSNATRQAAQWRGSRPQDAADMDKLAALPTAEWVGDSEVDQLGAYIDAAHAKGELPVTVAYNIPARDCGMYSSGGAAGEEHYKAYIDKYAQAIGAKPAVVILEPDALAQVTSDEHEGDSCLDHGGQAMRYSLLNYAVDKFEALPAAVVYLDAGNSDWIVDVKEMAARLKAAGIHKADGFSLNVSNFRTNEETTKYGENLSKEVDGKHFVIDTSRNGLGPHKNEARPDFSWCNPPGRALGHYPTTQTNDPLIDAYLYIKTAGESDGTDPDYLKCAGGPKAGEWWPEYALGLIQRWPKDLQPH
jgi:endoglucanase